MDKRQFECQYCGERKIDHDYYMNGQSACQDCATIRNTNPAMFDLLVKMMRRKIEQLDTDLRDYVNNSMDDD